MKKILKFLTGRLFIFGFAIAIQLALIFLLVYKMASYGYLVYAVMGILSVAAMLFVVSKHENPAYKLAWIIPMMMFPIFGWLIYYLFGRSKVSKKQLIHMTKVAKMTMPLLPQNNAIMATLEESDKSFANQAQYILSTSLFPIWENTTAQYLSPGEAFFDVLCQKLEGAKEFIFMEYFIVEQGIMWDKVLDILARKVKEGVEVKFLYDDLGCISTLPRGYHKVLTNLGIEVHVVNVFRPSLDTFMNYRDHRKITVIDGNIGFTGGNNLADEYINAYVKHGHWKDASIMITGDAVWNLSMMFLQMWQYYDTEKLDYDRYKPQAKENLPFKTDGYVLPFCDGPLDNYLIGEVAYMNMIERANDYVFINTPYLILDNEMKTALENAAYSGVKVTIITPHIADKWYVHMVTRFNYTDLVKAGVEIYEYTPGFVHAKTIVVDDEIAIVGTQNFDFRSFYLHFECGVLLYKNSEIAALRADNLETLKKCQRITLEECRPRNPFKRFVQLILNLFSPLM